MHSISPNSSHGAFYTCNIIHSTPECREAFIFIAYFQIIVSAFHKSPRNLKGQRGWHNQAENDLSSAPDPKKLFPYGRIGTITGSEIE